jgi:hypothetical protein
MSAIGVESVVEERCPVASLHAPAQPVGVGRSCGGAGGGTAGALAGALCASAARRSALGILASCFTSA